MNGASGFLNLNGNVDHFGPKTFGSSGWSLEQLVLGGPKTNESYRTQISTEIIDKLTQEPELRMIKKHRFIKLNKL